MMGRDLESLGMECFWTVHGGGTRCSRDIQGGGYVDLLGNMGAQGQQSTCHSRVPLHGVHPQ